MSIGGPTPKEESEPPSFQDQPKEAYEYLQKCYLEARRRGENYMATCLTGDSISLGKAKLKPFWSS